MLFEYSLVALIVCVIAALCVIGNRLGLWNSWLMCAAGAFTFAILLNVATTLSPFASGFIMAAFTALLRWLGSEHSALVATATPAGLQHVGHR